MGTQKKKTDTKIEEVKKNNISMISSKKTIEAIRLKEDIKTYQKNDTKEIEKPYDEITKKELLNSSGLSSENTVINIIMQFLKIILLCIPNCGAFFIGEQCTGKSALYSLFFKDLCTKISGNITLATLRGDARKNDESTCLLEKNTVIFEEMMNDPKLNGDIIGLLKDCMESQVFLKGNDISTITKTSFIFIGNNYTHFSKFIDITSKKLLENLPKEFNDRAFFDRIPIILPHYYSLLGKIKYIDGDELIIPVTELENILINIRKTPIKFILNEIENELSERELKFFNSIIFYLSCLFYLKEEKNVIPTWFIKGWIEFLKYFRGLLTDKFHNPFNKNSVKLILYLLNYNLDEIEYVAFDNQDRLIIKLLNKDFFHKIALTGFGCENNRIEIEYFKKNKCPSILPIISLEKNDTLLIQESGEYLPDERIYFNKILELNNSYNKTDPEYNNFVLEKMAKGENNYSFRGIPDFYKKSLLLKVKNIFKKDISEIELKDFSFEKEQIRIINFHNYLKN